MRTFEIDETVILNGEHLFANLLKIPGVKETTSETSYKIPGPYDIAMAFGAAMVASGKCETIGAAMAQAWMAIPEFYQARDIYLRDMVPMIYGTVPDDGEGIAADHD